MAVDPDHFELMAEAIREAEISNAEGGLPIGAVLTRDKRVAVTPKRSLVGFRKGWKTTRKNTL